MIESLLLSVCLYGNEEACSNAVISYYKYTGIEFLVTQKEQRFRGEYPLLSTTIAIGSTLAQGTTTLPLGQGKALTIDSKRSMLVYKVGF